MDIKKTPEQIMADFKKGEWFVAARDENPDYHTMALLASQTLPNQSAQELLTNADLIERWLNEPDYKTRQYFTQQKIPAE